MRSALSLSATFWQRSLAVFKWEIMRVILRNKRTRRCCAGPNEWVATDAQALHFPNVALATRFALDENLPDTELVIMYDVVPQEVALPLLPEWCNFGHPESAAP